MRLDLSKNALSTLPENFGALEKLQYLDLFSNKLSTLPVSFYRLKNLRWLDVKDNQLNDQLKKIVGDCLDDVQCKQCAKNVRMLQNIYCKKENNLSKHKKTTQPYPTYASLVNIYRSNIY